MGCCLSWTKLPMKCMTNNTPLGVSLVTLANRNAKSWVFQFHCVLFPSCKNVISTSMINSFSPPARDQRNHPWRGSHWKKWQHAREEFSAKNYSGVAGTVSQNVELRQELTIEKRKALGLRKNRYSNIPKAPIDIQAHNIKSWKIMVIPMRTFLLLFTLTIGLGEWG